MKRAVVIEHDDLRGKLQKIPNLPTAGGTYVLNVTVTGGVPTYSWQAQ